MPTGDVSGLVEKGGIGKGVAVGQPGTKIGQGDKDEIVFLLNLFEQGVSFLDFMAVEVDVVVVFETDIDLGKFIKAVLGIDRDQGGKIRGILAHGEVVVDLERESAFAPLAIEIEGVAGRPFGQGNVDPVVAGGGGDKKIQFGREIRAPQVAAPKTVVVGRILLVTNDGGADRIVFL